MGGLVVSEEETTKRAKGRVIRRAPESRRRALALAGLHGLGFGVVALVLLRFHLPAEHLRLMLQTGQEAPEVGQALVLTGIFHGLVSLAVWTIVYGLGRGVVKAVRGRGQEEMKRSLAVGRGAVFLESIMAIPVLLLLTMGLLQLSVLNLTAALVNVAGYQGARAVWVWQPEADAGRSGVNQAEVNERARIAVALVMTPVVAGDQRMIGSGISPQATAMARAMYARFALDVSPGGIAALLVPVGGTNEMTELSVSRAFDTGALDRRAVRKFLFAYMMTDTGDGMAQGDGVGVIREGGVIGVRFEFDQYIAMPLIGRFFGDPRLIGGSGGRRGFFRTWEQAFVFPEQPHGVNHRTP